MANPGELPASVVMRQVEGEYVANHEATGVSAHGETEADALAWLAEAVALEVGSEAAIDDPLTFLDSLDTDP